MAGGISIDLCMVQGFTPISGPFSSGLQCPNTEKDRISIGLPGKRCKSINREQMVSKSVSFWMQECPSKAPVSPEW